MTIQTLSPIKRSEHDEQVAFVQWFRSRYRTLIFAIPNGAQLAGREKNRCAQWQKLKAEGATPGVPDLYIPEWNLWIEMKRKKGGVLSDSQLNIINRLKAYGHTVVVCHGAESAKQAILHIEEQRNNAQHSN